MFRKVSFQKVDAQSFRKFDRSIIEMGGKGMSSREWHRKVRPVLKNTDLSLQPQDGAVCMLDVDHDITITLQSCEKNGVSYIFLLNIYLKNKKCSI